jgi:ribosomal protein L20A (L18A)
MATILKWRKLTTMEWDAITKDKFEKMTSRIPLFHRHITEEAVSKMAQENALARKSSKIEEVDVVSAFFSGVPSPFYSMMIRLLEQAGFDYKKFGFPRESK